MDLADNIVIAYQVQSPFSQGIYSDIVYRKLLPDGSSTGIVGIALTPQISLSLPSFSHETRPSLAVTGPDRFWLVWENTDGRDGAENGIFAQGYRITRPPLFSDGFESGDLSAWSASFP